MNVYMVIGNGVTLDLVQELRKEKDIDLKNLFRNGEKVKWPGDDRVGYLSYKRCPALWRLGARPHSTREEYQKIVTDIITCANVYASIEIKKDQG
ncbi:hypothetical protein CSA37_01490 [Candidatus Fermentibacteria bacterium]|nr:MAG: hypothetical protein CSA37_01490 [Candidatus Fermentibacteria bacterium]